jgi:oxygen-independent coproporphyrinogen III oxidase
MSFAAPPWLEPRTAYVHVPFCGHHCGYCDFAVSAGQDELVEPYLDALEIELRSLDRPRPVETIFIGGGTPTYLRLPQLERLLSSIRRWLPPVAGTHLEFSIESTPESLDTDKVALMHDFGVNRVSIGVQSFHGHLLESLDRRHGIEQIEKSIDAVRARIPAISLDLIFAAPGQSLEEWDRDLDAALEFRPEHLSTYGLTYEKGTPLWKSRERGTLRTVGENDELAMYERAMDRLTAAGYEQYEISNFARPGHRCRHNERYWANDAYFGVGVGAARYVDGSREMNTRDTALYIQRVRAGESPTFQRERLPPRERAFETLAVQLRRSDGIDRDDFRKRTGFELDELIREPLAVFVDDGLLFDDGRTVTLSRRGRCLADGIIMHFMKSS